MPVISQTMWARWLLSMTSAGLVTESVSFSPTSVLEMRTVSMPLVEISAYCRDGRLVFSTHTRWALFKSSMTPVISTGLVALRFDIRVWMAESFSELLDVSYCFADGSRAVSATKTEGANNEDIIMHVKKNASWFFALLENRPSLVWGVCSS